MNLIVLMMVFKDAVSKEVASQKMKTELISNVSHDLKTPLTSIISYIDLLKNEDLSKEQQDEYIDILDRNTKRLKHLLKIYLKYLKSIVEISN